MRIPVVIVDDEEIDRLIASKRIARSPWAKILTPIIEVASGDVFLENLFQTDALPDGRKLVLMDINMPGRNGFETIEEMRRRLPKGGDGYVVIVYTSSENAGDVARAKALDLVREFIVKPLDDADIETIVRVFGLKPPETAPDGTLLH